MVFSPSVASRIQNGPAELALGGDCVPGLVLSASAELGVFLFVPTAEVEPPREGSRVRIRWAGAADFGAEAELLEVEDEERWVLSVPAPLAPARQRRSTRLRAEEDWVFVTEDGDEVELFDLSARGLGLVFPRGEGPQGRGATLRGTLIQAGGGRWKATLCCTNVRPHPDDERHWVVGTRMTLASPAVAEILDDVVEALIDG